jgi:hypothetical protein
MCGIVAVIDKPREGEWKETHALLSELLVQSMERGVDATGFAAITRAAGSSGCIDRTFS